MLKKTGSILFLLCAAAAAGELSFSASVDRTTVGTNELLRLTLTVAGENIGGVPSPQLPELPNFNVSTPSSSQSTSIQFINGKITQQQTITLVYSLRPRETGEFTIGACVIEYRGERYETQPISITVVKGSSPAPPPSTGPLPSKPSVPIKDNLKLIASPSRSNVYVGEQVTIEFTFYNRLDLADINLSQNPTFSDCWVEPIFDAQQLNYQQQTINGILYNAALLKKTALFPISAGEIEISPMKLNVLVIVQRGFFSNDVQQSEVASKPLTITVNPLPEGAPDGFTGGVGTFMVTASINQDTSVAGEPIYLNIRMSGTGNIRLIENPDVPAIPGVKILDPEIKDNINTSGPSISGYKEFRYPLIPGHDGKHVIPAMQIAYFDPRAKSYKILETEKMEFIATQTAAALQPAQAEGMEILGMDIRHIKKDQTALTSSTGYMGWWLVSLYILGCLFVAGSLVYRRHQARMLTDRAYARKLRASRRVKKDMRVAEKALKGNNIPQFLDYLSRIVLGYIGDRFNLDTGAMTKEQVLDILRQNGVDNDLLQQLDELLHQCDVVRYSPNMTCDDPEHLYRTTKKLLSSL